MNPLHTFRSALIGAALLVAGPALSQDAPSPGSPAALLDALSLVTGGMLPMAGVLPQVTQDGGTSRVAIPLPGLASPADAAITVTATADDAGVWDITGVTVPPTGMIEMGGNPPGAMLYTIGQQAAHGRIDPTLRVPSPYALAFSDIVFRFGGPARAQVAMDQLMTAGTLTGGAGGRVTKAIRGSIENMTVTALDKNDAPVAVALRGLALRYDVRDMDMAAAKRLGEVARAITAEPPPPPSKTRRPGQPPDMAPAMRKLLRAYVEAAPGMMSGFTVEDTVNGLHIEAADGRTGDIGEMRVGVAGEAKGDTVGGSIDLGMDGMAFPAASGPYAGYVPSKIVLRTVFDGIPAEKLRHWLLATTRDGADPAALQAEALALLNHPGAKAGIETLQVNAGPARIEGTANVGAEPDGTPSYQVHLAAQGMDALLAQIQSDPNARQILPMLFLAKGFAKQVGDRLVWDIRFAHGMVTVNGVSLPLGPPNAKKPR